MSTAVDRSSTIPMIPIRAFRTPVRGYAFASPPPGGEGAVVGLPAELAREPDNPADPLAVAVWASPSSGARWRIGYLDRGVAARVAPRLDAGGRVRAQLDGWSTEPQGRWRRPLLLLLPDDDPAAIPPGASAVAAEAGPQPIVSPEPGVGPEPGEGPEPVLTGPVLVSPPDVTARGGGEAHDTSVAGDDVPRIWGRPPGVRRRRVS